MDQNKVQTVDPSFIAEVGNNMVKQAQELTGGRHILVIDPGLMKPMDRVTTAQLLRSQNAAEVQMYRDSRIEYPPETAQARMPLLYLLRPDMRRLRQVCNAFKADAARSLQRIYIVAFVPAVPAGAHALAEEEGVLGPQFRLHDLPLLLFPLDEDLLSMELEAAFRCLQSDGDRTLLASVARALIGIENATRPAGPAPVWHLFGDSARTVYDLCEQLRAPTAAANAANPSAVHHHAVGPGSGATPSNEGFGQVIILSREVDLVTPLTLQRLYAGCLDDCFRVTSGLLVVPRAQQQQPQAQQQPQQQRLFVSKREDPVFKELSDLHMASVPDRLREVARTLTEFERQGRAAQTVAQMRNFVQNELRDLTFKKRSLTAHISLCEEVNRRFNNLKEFLHAEECMLIGADPTDASVRQTIGVRSYYADYFAECCVRRADPRHTLRLMCLHSLTCGGFSADDLSRLRMAFCQAHGFQHVATFAALHRAGLLTPRDSVGHVAAITGGGRQAATSADFPTLRKRLQLVERDPAADERGQKRLSYVMSGLCEPLSGKLIQLALSSQLHPHSMPAHSQGQQQQGTSLADCPFYTKMQLYNSRYAPTGGRTALVVMLGGCTYTEVAAVRQIASSCRVSVQLLTTGIFGCCDLLAQLCPALTPSAQG